VTALLNNRYAIVAVLAIVVVLLPFTFPSSYYLRVASLVWVSAFAAIGLNVLMGKAGQVSLGHAAFFGHSDQQFEVSDFQFRAHIVMSVVHRIPENKQ